LLTGGRGGIPTANSARVRVRSGRGPL
jgi:hypothetical protein